MKASQRMASGSWVSANFHSQKKNRVLNSTRNECKQWGLGLYRSRERHAIIQDFQ